MSLTRGAGTFRAFASALALMPSGTRKSLNLRTHTAVVEIPYSTKAFSIRYKDSVNLDYTGESIHSNYNGWIQNLEKGIRTQLQSL